MKLLLAGGGTGGHLFPAISIAEEFLARDPGNEVVFAGTSKGLEARVIPDMGHPLELVSSGGMTGRGALRAAGAALAACRGLVQSLGMMRRLRPDVVLGVGGYASGPVVLAAWLCRVPAAVCEQNSVPGITNRTLGRIARKVLVGFEECTRHFPAGKTAVVGNPVRRGILERASGNHRGPRAETRKTILVLGGSQGAHALNVSLPGALGILGESAVRVIHQTGPDDLADTAREYEGLGITAEVSGFIDDMASVYAGADLVVCRSGAGTVSELMVMGLPSVLVPYPFSAHGHQLSNARALERAGAAVVIEQGELSPESLAAVIAGLLAGDRLGEMGAAASRQARPGAAGEIVDILYELGTGSEKD